MDQLNIGNARRNKIDPELALAKALGQWPPAPPKPKLNIRVGAKIDHKAGAPGVATVSVEALARELGLKLGDQNELTNRRIKRGKGYSFVRANGAHIRD